jgi:hypothetical protein
VRQDEQGLGPFDDAVAGGERAAHAEHASAGAAAPPPDKAESPPGFGALAALSSSSLSSSQRPQVQVSERLLDTLMDKVAEKLAPVVESAMVLAEQNQRCYAVIGEQHEQLRRMTEQLLGVEEDIRRVTQQLQRVFGDDFLSRQSPAAPASKRAAANANATATATAVRKRSAEAAGLDLDEVTDESASAAQSLQPPDFHSYVMSHARDAQVLFQAVGAMTNEQFQQLRADSLAALLPVVLSALRTQPPEGYLGPLVLLYEANHRFPRVVAEAGGGRFVRECLKGEGLARERAHLLVAAHAPAVLDKRAASFPGFPAFSVQDMRALLQQLREAAARAI